MKKHMQLQLKMEELAMLLFSFGLFAYLNAPWWWYAALFFAPDLSFAAYAINTKTGAFFYNLLHHKGVALLVFVIGVYFGWQFCAAIGAVFFGHSSFDRIMGYGLKYPDSFQHTHLGMIGKNKGPEVL